MPFREYGPYRKSEELTTLKAALDAVRQELTVTHYQGRGNRARQQARQNGLDDDGLGRALHRRRTCGVNEIAPVRVTVAENSPCRSKGLAVP